MNVTITNMVGCQWKNCFPGLIRYQGANGNDFTKCVLYENGNRGSFWQAQPSLELQIFIYFHLLTNYTFEFCTLKLICGHESGINLVPYQAYFHLFPFANQLCVWVLYQCCWDFQSQIPGLVYIAHKTKYNFIIVTKLKLWNPHMKTWTKSVTKFALAPMVKQYDLDHYIGLVEVQTLLPAHPK